LNSRSVYAWVLLSN